MNKPPEKTYMQKASKIFDLVEGWEGVINW